MTNKKDSVATPPEPPTGFRPEWEGQPRLAAIIGAVLAALGRPDNFMRATIRSVREDAFRVNVMTGTDPTTVRIAHSYFLTADAEGRLTGSNPAIRKCY